MKNNAKKQSPPWFPLTFCTLLSSPLAALHRFAVLSGIVMLFFDNVANGSITYYWDGSQASANSGSDPNINMGNFSTGNSGPTMIYTGTSVPSDYPGASGGDNFQARDPGSDPSVTSSSTYFSVTLTPDSGYTVTLNSVSLGSRSTSTGPVSIAFYSSIDSYTAALGSASSSGTWNFQTISFGGNSLTIHSVLNNAA